MLAPARTVERPPDAHNGQPKRRAPAPGTGHRVPGTGHRAPSGWVTHMSSRGMITNGGHLARRVCSSKTTHCETIDQW